MTDIIINSSSSIIIMIIMSMIISSSTNVDRSDTRRNKSKCTYNRVASARRAVNIVL